MYWVRSLVPSEKKSTLRASRAAVSAVAGTSTVIPSSSAASIPVCSRARAKIWSARLQLVGGGDHRQHRLHRMLRRDPQDCPQLGREQLLPAADRRGSRASPGMGCPRAASPAPAAACRRPRRACAPPDPDRPEPRRSPAGSRACSSSSGRWSRSRNRDSVRSMPTPSAPNATARTVSATDPTFANTCIRWPSRVIAGSPARRLTAAA